LRLTDEARLALSYKGSEYKTQWLEYPDIAPTLKAFGLERNRDGNIPYTLPAIRFEDGGRRLESSKIIQELERRYPAPTMKGDDPIVREVVDAIILCMRAAPDILPRVPRILLHSKSAELFETTRSLKFKVALDQLGKQQGSPVLAEEDAVVGFQKAAELLKENPDGPFFMGKKGKASPK